MTNLAIRSSRAIDALMREPIPYVGSKVFHVLRPKAVRHTLQITSIGGVGTTFLYRFAESARLNIFRSYDGGPVVSDYGLWKHTRFPIGTARHSDRQPRPEYRVVYLVGDPRDALVSIYRRGFDKWAVDRLDLLPDQLAALSSCDTLEDYLEHETDLFGFADHIYNWTTRSVTKSYPIMVLKYDAIWNYKDQLMDFMRVPHRYRDAFPQRRSRQSNWTSLPESTQQQLGEIYGELAQFVDDLPDMYFR